MHNKLLPWHQQQWQQYQTACHNNSFAHAWLLSGISGVGKRCFAKYLAQSRLCTQPNSAMQACGDCRSCQLFIAGNHPDFNLLQPQSSNGSIKVDHIRDLQAVLLQTSQLNGERIAIIEPAEAMNMSAMNALLKILEEPPQQCYLLLITHDSYLLLPTIQSRCQKLKFHGSFTADTQQWLVQQSSQVATADNNGYADAKLLLTVTHGAPLNALALASDQQWQMRQNVLLGIVALLDGEKSPIQLAKEYSECPIHCVMDYFLTCLADVLCIQAKVNEQYITNGDLKQPLKKLANAYDSIKIYTLFDKILANKRLLLEKTNINLQLLLESVFIEFYSASKGGVKKL